MNRTVVTGLLLTLSFASVAAAEHSSEQGTRAGHAANAHMNERSFAELVGNFESDERMAWQMPDRLVAKLGPLEGKTVADIGSGSGFLAFRMAAQGARVLCIDIDERFLAYILGKRDALELGDRIEPRLSPPDRPALEPEEVDLVVTVNTYHHIEDRVAYFGKVRSALRSGGRLVVVDFVEGELPVGPAPAMKIPATRIEEELRAAGFEEITLDRETLPYQFVLTAY
ncbi:MAG: class I SAM-dependent methyltransferase [Pseudomonadales bacterium]|jgi:SAM-dependent methyltransferase|nr:class I SAM-dependent methyltransferase [Pseudomonadales bacterium]